MSSVLPHFSFASRVAFLFGTEDVRLIKFLYFYRNHALYQDKVKPSVRYIRNHNTIYDGHVSNEWHLWMRSDPKVGRKWKYVSWSSTHIRVQQQRSMYIRIHSPQSGDWHCGKKFALTLRNFQGWLNLVGGFYLRWFCVTFSIKHLYTNTFPSLFLLFVSMLYFNYNIFTII